MTGKIKGTGSYIPVQVWDNDKLSHMMDTSDEWIRGRTGIGQRHIASGEETVSYMAAKAGEAALADAKMKPEEIDLILVSTMSAEIIMPCAACEVQKLLGAVHATCFDLNGACTGFLLALNTAQAYLGGRIYRTALVIGAEALSHLTNWQDRAPACCLAMEPGLWCWKQIRRRCTFRPLIPEMAEARLPVPAEISRDLQKKMQTLRPLTCRWMERKYSNLQFQRCRR